VLLLHRPEQLGSAPRSGPKQFPEICVVGGGFTGIAAAIAILRKIEVPFRLTVIEPGELGRGVAFGSQHPLHLLNVRARDLSVSVSQPGDFLNWAFRQLDQGESNAALHAGLAHSFLPRQLFGEYVRQRFAETAAQRSDVDVRVVHARATACTPADDGFLVSIDQGAPVAADIVILATAYGAQPGLGLGALSPYGDVRGQSFARAKSMALVGAGLTMVDALLAARRGGFQGVATVISRRGLLPRPHAPEGVPHYEVRLPRSKHVSLLAAAIRLTCEAAEADGTPWQAVVNEVRSSFQDLWQALSVREQARFLRHLRPFWDVHRHRLPIEVHAQLHSEFDRGRAMLLRGSVKGVWQDEGGFKISVLPRGRASVALIQADLAFDCSGHRPDLKSPLIASLVAQGFACYDPHGLGLAVRPNGQILGQDGRETPGLFALGPLCQGSLFEITAVPEIVRQTAATAEAISRYEKIAPGESAGTQPS
jgi:uncharacterized NAD(P)/FAD-binding protein YdhS